MLKNLLLVLTRRADLALALLVGTIVFLMILPVPTLFVDVFIAVNIGMAIALLMIGVYIPSPLSFSTLPSVLLLSTLFRLALTITTTRLILAQADAGDIVYAFGDFVVAGNLVVGIVVFLIITIVQFVVVTKGAERVAEVCARFSLDGMPGKQMSIDADLRAGVIDTAEAVRRRSRLEQQSQLYGSMDGAMKFVKGDAIAGLCIIVVNIVGGIATGVLQHDMALSEAVAIYTTLTIGDGLVAQVPALFMAITAGIIVTRTSSAGTDTNLGSDIGDQILAQPNALLVAGAACFGLALLPGFPATVFLLLGALFGGVGLVIKTAERQRRESSSLLGDPDCGELQASADTGSATSPVLLRLPACLLDSNGLRGLNAEIASARCALFNELGIGFPKVHLQPADADATAESNHFSIDVHGVPVQQGRLPPERPHFAADVATLGRLDIACEPTAVRAALVPGGWLDDSAAEAARAATLEVVTRSHYLALQLSAVVSRHAADLFGLQQARALLDGAQIEHPDLVKEVNKVVSVQQLGAVLKRLIAEGVSIRDLPTILETLVEISGGDKNPGALAEQLRGALRRQICHRISGPDGELPVLLLSDDTEAAILASASAEVTDSLELVERRLHIKRRLSEALLARQRQSMSRRPPILVTQAKLRRYVRSLLGLEGHHIAVLSYGELAGQYQVQPLDELRLLD